MSEMREQHEPEMTQEEKDAQEWMNASLGKPAKYVQYTMSERDRLVEIIQLCDIPYTPVKQAEKLADAIIKEGFGDVAAKDKRIAELERGIKDVISSKDIPQEYAKLINKHFWELTAEADPTGEQIGGEL